jgi:hypothetical protein
MPENDIEEVVDEFVDALDVPHLESEAERLGITRDDLLARIMNEAKARWE